MDVQLENAETQRTAIHAALTDASATRVTIARSMQKLIALTDQPAGRTVVATHKATYDRALEIAIEALDKSTEGDLVCDVLEFCKNCVYDQPTLAEALTSHDKGLPFLVRVLTSCISQESTLDMALWTLANAVCLDAACHDAVITYAPTGDNADVIGAVMNVLQIHADDTRVAKRGLITLQALLHDAPLAKDAFMARAGTALVVELMHEHQNIAVVTWRGLLIFQELAADLDPAVATHRRRALLEADVFDLACTYVSRATRSSTDPAHVGAGLDLIRALTAAVPVDDDERADTVTRTVRTACLAIACAAFQRSSVVVKAALRCVLPFLEADAVGRPVPPPQLPTGAPDDTVDAAIETAAAAADDPEPATPMDVFCDQGGLAQTVRLLDIHASDDVLILALRTVNACVYHHPENIGRMRTASGLVYLVRVLGAAAGVATRDPRANLARHVMCVVKNVAAHSTAVADNMGRMGAIPRILSILDALGHDPAVVGEAMWTINNLIVGCRGNQDRVRLKNGVLAILGGIETHANVPAVLHHGSLLVYNLAVANEHARNAFGAQGAANTLAGVLGRIANTLASAAPLSPEPDAPTPPDMLPWLPCAANTILGIQRFLERDIFMRPRLMRIGLPASLNTLISALDPHHSTAETPPGAETQEDADPAEADASPDAAAGNQDHDQGHDEGKDEDEDKDKDAAESEQQPDPAVNSEDPLEVCKEARALLASVTFDCAHAEATIPEITNEFSETDPTCTGRGSLGGLRFMTSVVHGDIKWPVAVEVVEMSPEERANGGKLIEMLRQHHHPNVAALLHYFEWSPPAPTGDSGGDIAARGRMSSFWKRFRSVIGPKSSGGQGAADDADASDPDAPMEPVHVFVFERGSLGTLSQLMQLGGRRGRVRTEYDVFRAGSLVVILDEAEDVDMYKVRCLADEQEGWIPLHFVTVQTRREQFRWRDRLSVFQGICDALVSLHGSSFVHGNLTPESIFIGRNAEALLVPNYRRQQKHEDAGHDHRHDIDAMGSLLLLLLTGKTAAQLRRLAATQASLVPQLPSVDDSDDSDGEPVMSVGIGAGVGSLNLPVSYPMDRAAFWDDDIFAMLVTVAKRCQVFDHDTSATDADTPDDADNNETASPALAESEDPFPSTLALAECLALYFSEEVLASAF